MKALFSLILVARDVGTGSPLIDKDAGGFSLEGDSETAVGTEMESKVVSFAAREPPPTDTKFSGKDDLSLVASPVNYY
ncbi:hypothetical protein BJX64DRAFT_250850 [Aspergillus heterothallicus]